MNLACAVLPIGGESTPAGNPDIRLNAAAVMARTLGAWLVQDSPKELKTSWRDQVKDRELAVSMTSSLLSTLRSGKQALSKIKELG
jgi:hypothetical protein